MRRTWRPWLSWTRMRRLGNMGTVPRIDPSRGPALSLQPPSSSVLIPPQVTGWAALNCCFCPRRTMLQPWAAGAGQETKRHLKEGSLGSALLTQETVSSPGHEAQLKRKKSVLRTDLLSMVVWRYSKVPSWTYILSLLKRKSYKKPVNKKLVSIRLRLYTLKFTGLSLSDFGHRPLHICPYQSTKLEPMVIRSDDGSSLYQQA